MQITPEMLAPRSSSVLTFDMGQRPMPRIRAPRLLFITFVHPPWEGTLQVAVRSRVRVFNPRPELWDVRISGEKFMPSLLDQARAIESELVDIRRDLHAHPEVAWEEHRTGQRTADFC